MTLDSALKNLSSFILNPLFNLLNLSNQLTKSNSVLNKFLRGLLEENLLYQWLYYAVLAIEYLEKTLLSFYFRESALMHFVDYWTLPEE